MSFVSESFAEDLAKPSGAAIVSPDAKLEHLFTRSAKIEGGLTEGPAVAPDGAIYFSDIPFGQDHGKIMKFDPKSKLTTVFAEDSGKSNGLIFDSTGFLLAAEGADFGGRCISRWDVKTGKKTVLADRYQGKHFNAPNDICVDRPGRIYFTDPKYVGAEPREQEHRSVYRVDRDGTVIEITHDVGKPNGIAISPDGQTMYLADHDNGLDRIGSDEKPKPGVMKVYAFPLGADGKINGLRKTIVDFGDQAGCDGMTVDEFGDVYLTARGLKRPGVLVVDPTGKEVAFIPTGAPNQTSDAPVGFPSNVEFGVGDEAHVLYITIDKSLFRIPLKVKGYHVQYLKK
jgi:gluconolactonase